MSIDVNGKRISQIVIAPLDGTASNPSISFGGDSSNNSGTGLYGTGTTISHAISGVNASTLSSTLLTLAVSLSMGNDVVILTNAGVPTNGGAGTGVGVAGPGSICVDYTNANLYVNGNTKASPTWKLVTRAA